MSLRSYLNNNPAIVTIAAIVVLLVCLGLIYNSLNRGGPSGPVPVYFYDLNTGEPFEASSDLLPPIEAPSGPYNGQPGGVRAYVYSCTDCSDESSHKVAYLEMYTADAKRLLSNPDQMQPEDMDTVESGRLVAAPGPEPRFFPAMSPPGMDITDRGDLCPGTYPKSCEP